MSLPRFTSIFAAAFMATQATAHAENFYVGVKAGYNSAMDASINESCSFLVCDEDGVAFYKSGLGAGLVFGLDKSFGWRLEGELTYRENAFDEVRWFGGERPTDGNVQSIAFMANLIYDFNDFAHEPVQPYLGGGVGAVNVSFDGVRDANGAVFDGSETVFAGQVIGGAGFTIRPSTTFFFDYRLMVTEDMAMVVNSGQTTNIAGDLIDIEYMTQSVMIGVRQSF